MDLVINIMNQLFFYILEKNQVSVCLMNLLAYLCCDLGENFFFFFCSYHQRKSHIHLAADWLKVPSFLLTLHAFITL